MKSSFSLLFSLLIMQTAFSQNTYEESQYKYRSQEVEPQGYVKWYVNKNDTNYLLRKFFLDSAGTKLVAKAFFHRGLQDGPYTGYDMDQVAMTGAYKKGKPDGERKLFLNGVLIKKDHYKEGKKSGVWEEYHLNGVLKRKTTYNEQGSVVNEEQF